jgi:pimeloyl-ACP methyl ester carboxylesterase
MHMSKKKKKGTSVLKAAAGTLAAGAAAYSGYGYYIFRQAFDSRHSRFHPNGPVTDSITLAQGSDWLRESTHTDDYLQSYDGLTMHAVRVENHPESNRWFVMVPGFHRCALDLLYLMKEADDRGWNMLVTDPRGSGQSQGGFTGLGWPEHYDLISWVNYLVVLRPEAEIVLYGIDMGANAVMNALGDYLPRNVKGAVEEGGYSEIREELVFLADQYTSIPTRPFLPVIDLLVKQFLHFSLNDVSTLRQLGQAEIPLLLIHGSDDEIVPESMAEDCARACRSDTELVVLNATGFGGCRYHADYADIIFEFADKCTGTGEPEKTEGNTSAGITETETAETPAEPAAVTEEAPAEAAEPSVSSEEAPAETAAEESAPAADNAEEFEVAAE